MFGNSSGGLPPPRTPPGRLGDGSPQAPRFAGGPGGAVPEPPGGVRGGGSPPGEFPNISSYPFGAAQKLAVFTVRSTATMERMKQTKTNDTLHKRSLLQTPFLRASQTDRITNRLDPMVMAKECRASIGITTSLGGTERI